MDKKETILENDKKFILRSDTAKQMGITLKALTDLAKELKIRKYDISDFTAHYTREELYNLLMERINKGITRDIIADELNISKYALRVLCKELNIKTQIGRPIKEEK